MSASTTNRLLGAFRNDVLVWSSIVSRQFDANRTFREWGHHCPRSKRARTTRAREAKQPKGDIEWEEEESSWCETSEYGSQKYEMSRRRLEIQVTEADQADDFHRILRW